MPPGSPAGNRSFGLTGAGKGSAERSSKWRDNYPEVQWTGVTGFVRKGAKLVKGYQAKPEPEDV